MIEAHEGGGFSITGPEDIGFFRLLTMRAGLRMEVKHPGIRMSRGPTCYTIARREFGFRGNKAKVLAQLEAHVEAVKAARERDCEEGICGDDDCRTCFPDIAAQ